MKTIIQDLGMLQGNHLWMKREDLIPFSFGGNKARKAELFFREIDGGGYDSVVTYGSGSSNHCRVVANECCRRGLRCCIVSPDGSDEALFNRRMTELFGAEITAAPLDEIHGTIERKLEELRSEGEKPYFIAGGGHGPIGTRAYVECYGEIKSFEEENGVHFDQIFLASGTGTTQAGLVCGQILAGDERKIVGISIARKNQRGRDVVLESVRDYLGDRAREEEIEGKTIFIDSYTTGYGKRDERVTKTIETVLKSFGIPLDPVYTGKAFFGMTEQLRETSGENVLFIHTGGTPLFFDALSGHS